MSVALLKQHGADINEVYNNRTPLFAAIETISFEMIKFVIELGADVNLSFHTTTPLMKAISSQNLAYEIVELLLQNGAEVNKAVNYETPIMRAIRIGDIQILELLIQYGADIKIGNAEVNGEFVALTMGIDIQQVLESIDCAN